MKNICTHETASRLKAAGSPQPEPAAGQVWYDSPGRAFTVLNVVAPGVCDAWWHCFGTVERWSVIGAFAPTAADILRELPGYSLGLFNKSAHAFAAEYLRWIVQDNVGDVVCDHEHNPAEACAAAWLELKKEKTKQ